MIDVSNVGDDVVNLHGFDGRRVKILLTTNLLHQIIISSDLPNCTATIVLFPTSFNYPLLCKCPATDLA